MRNPKWKVLYGTGFFAILIFGRCGRFRGAVDLLLFIIMAVFGGWPHSYDKKHVYASEKPFVAVTHTGHTER